MVLVRGHVIEWHYDKEVQFTGHWSRLDGCVAYRGYLRERIEREVVSHGIV